MLINSEAKRQRRISQIEGENHASMMKTWKKKGAYKGDHVALDIKEQFGTGDFLDTDWGNELED